MAKVLGRYHIISELGRGGMGVVYKAVDPKLERFIAIKCLSDELSEDEITVTRFLREARNVAALNHPHIAQIFLADEDEGRPYFVMEFIDGESLAERLARDKRLMPEQARRIIIESAEALKAAHEENIVHRDIKPGNIMIDRRGRAILTDFGIASIVHPDQQPKISKYIMGTPGYLPPEVMTGQPADHRGDIFALGAVYYEMLAGKRLVPGRDIEDTARTLLASDFPVLADLDEKIDQSTFGVLGRMLAQDPGKRYQDYDALLADLASEPVENAVASAKAPAVAVNTSDEPTRLASSGAISAAAAQAANEPPPTEAVNPAATPPPTTAGAKPPAAGKQGGGLGLVIGLAAGLFLLVGASVASLAFLMPERWDQVTAMLASPFAGEAEDAAISPEPMSSSDATLAADLPLVDRVDMYGGSRTGDEDIDVRTTDDASLVEVGDGEPGRVDAGPGESDAGDSGFGETVGATPGESAIAAADAPVDPDEDAATESLSAASARVVEESAEDDARMRARQSSAVTGTAPDMPDADAEGSSPAVASASGDDQRLVVASAVGESAPQPAAVREATAPPPRPAAPAAVQPKGVLVVGVGDPVFVDPMVREIEEALRADGHDIIERGFVSGLSGLVGGGDVDLAGLSRAATQAGARWAVIARAMPAGQRQLEYYGRTDTAYTVQVETITYDLTARRRIDASELEQFEYTVLSATRQARDSVAPQLARISARLSD
ncbi:MAG: serine/threonine protein kinase [Wenzhouxiangella sp.]|nr:MAG: serine/threonine protein kinase [Wenzhouxiangella sp.]